MNKWGFFTSIALTCFALQAQEVMCWQRPGDVNVYTEIAYVGGQGQLTTRMFSAKPSTNGGFSVFENGKEIEPTVGQEYCISVEIEKVYASHSKRINHLRKYLGNSKWSAEYTTQQSYKFIQ